MGGHTRRDANGALDRFRRLTPHIERSFDTGHLAVVIALSRWIIEPFGAKNAYFVSLIRYAALNTDQMPSATTVSNINQQLSNVVGVALMALALMALVLQSVLDANLGHHVALGSIPTKGPKWVALAPRLSRAFSQTFIVYEAGIVLAFFVALTLPKAVRSRTRRGVIAAEESTELGLGILIEGVE